MNENIVIFLKKLERDEEAQKRMAACRNPEEAYQIAHAIQDGFTQEEFIEAMNQLCEQTSKDLTAEDLEKISGGEEGSDVAATVMATATIAVAVTYTQADITILTSAAASAA